MRAALRFLARRRGAGVGLALAAELLLLAGFSLAPPVDTVGIPATVAAAIAGTVAVVYGVVDGALVATAGALVFAALGGWEAGELAAVAVWPAIVAAVGLFARQIERNRIALRRLVDAHEDERRALALTLHDDSAQILTGALLTLRSGLGEDALATDRVLEARELIAETIQQLRRLALELSPQGLEDYGLASALGHLAETETTRAGVPVAFEGHWDGRLSSEAEWALFRFAQAALAAAAGGGATSITIRLAGEHGRVALTVAGTDAPPPQLPVAAAELIRLLGGQVAASTGGDSAFSLRAEVPGVLRVTDDSDAVISSGA